MRHASMHSLLHTFWCSAWDALAAVLVSWSAGPQWSKSQGFAYWPLASCWLYYAGWAGNHAGGTNMHSFCACRPFLYTISVLSCFIVASIRSNQLAAYQAARQAASCSACMVQPHIANIMQPDAGILQALALLLIHRKYSGLYSYY